MDALIVKGTRVLKETLQAEEEVIINEGGARSSKSYSIAQLICFKFFSEENKRILVTRKTFPSLRLTAMDEIVNMLKRWNVYNSDAHNKTYHEIKNGSNTIVFSPTDDFNKRASEGWNYIWIEEATDFTLQEYLMLRTRLSNISVDGKLNQMFLTCNPIDEFSFINQELRKETSVKYIHSTYLDNLKNLPETYIKVIENLDNIDNDFARIYKYGNWGKLSNLIFSNWSVGNEFPTQDKEGNLLNYCYGLDLGVVHPTALVKCIIHEDIIYLQEEIYKTELDNKGLLRELEIKQIPKHIPIYCSPEELRTRLFLIDNGYNIFKADNDVQQGLKKLREHKIVLVNSPNGEKEFKNYKRRTDSKGRVFEEPVKFMDDFADASRYGIFSMYGIGSLITIH